MWLQFGYTFQKYFILLAFINFSADSKSAAREGVRVRLPLLAPSKLRLVYYGKRASFFVSALVSPLGETLGFIGVSVISDS